MTKRDPSVVVNRRLLATERHPYGTKLQRFGATTKIRRYLPLQLPNSGLMSLAQSVSYSKKTTYWKTTLEAGLLVSGEYYRFPRCKIQRRTACKPGARRSPL